MKSILAVTTMIVLVSTTAVSAQQTGRVPTPPPPRAGGAASVTTPPAATSGSPVPSQPRPAPPANVRPLPNLPQTSPSGGRAAAARPTQTSILLELETPGAVGRIAVAIYRDAASFRRSEAPVRTLMLDRDGPITRAWVLGLPPGQYAIAAFQDVDGDGKLGTGSFRIPREPFGFSRDARGRFGPPGFDAAAFALTYAGTTQRIVLRNPMNALLR